METTEAKIKEFGGSDALSVSDFVKTILSDGTTSMYDRDSGIERQLTRTREAVANLCALLVSKGIVSADEVVREVLGAYGCEIMESDQ